MVVSVVSVVGAISIFFLIFLIFSHFFLFSLFPSPVPLFFFLVLFPCLFQLREQLLFTSSPSHLSIIGSFIRRLDLVLTTNDLSLLDSSCTCSSSPCSSSPPSCISCASCSSISSPGFSLNFLSFFSLLIYFLFL